MNASRHPQPHAAESAAPLQLTDLQREAIHRAACAWVAVAVGGTAELPDPTLAGAAQKVVSGAFVTLRHNGTLRGCCGCYGQAVTLANAVRQASFAAATRDPRMPSVTLDELPLLDVTVTLLHSIRPVMEQGSDRRRAVQIGRHGLRIACGDRRGLLLPVVAVEYGLSAEQFLEQVCAKAGLPSDAWKSEEAALETFEGIAIGGPFLESVLQPPESLP